MHMHDTCRSDLHTIQIRSAELSHVSAMAQTLTIHATPTDDMQLAHDAQAMHNILHQASTGIDCNFWKACGNDRGVYML